ncbi:hypothetical protein [Streptomyces sp. UH6]|uniref:hypothetical protein n=1 Tax=Streptomyces sp. UH6 TaxID=2748379 RepID=UPI0015D495D6|nr:hypothetical protein [Streptomyces sp. UH6]NYV73487.1 hypothetical protein [Streptomyces sp. UH6]
MDISKNSKAGPRKEEKPFLLYTALALTAVSVGWAGYSIAGITEGSVMGTVAMGLGMDAAWGVALLGLYRGVGGKKTHITLHVISWLLAAAAGVLMGWHAVEEWGGLAVAGGIIPLIAKGAWTLDLADRRARLEAAHAVRRAEDIVALAEADITVETAEADANHRRMLARIERDIELEIAEESRPERVRLARMSQRFRTEMEAYDMAEELRHRRALALPAGLSEPVGPDSGETGSALSSTALTAGDGQTGGQTRTDEPTSRFGFSAALRTDGGGQKPDSDRLRDVNAQRSATRADRIQWVRTQGQALSVPEVAKRFGVDERTARRYVADAQK